MKTIGKILILSCMAMLAGCASSHMTVVKDSPEKLTPASGKALVIFARTSIMGAAIQAPLFDGETYIATVSSGTKVAYQAKPGKHMFMLVGESADFMEADLQAGKTYYAGVVPRMGAFKARFSFNPNNKQISDRELKKWVSGTKLVETNAKGLVWAEKNAASIKSKREKYLPVWMDKENSNKQRLLRSSGY